ncbi:MAG: hypothetical protein LQ338_005585 [Usnochroma carphineum]|nr:MAG: hypothetical protein LQ338_005585 [Usnochroma carphineum]
MPHVKVRAQFMADIDDPAVVTYIWFLCNGHDGPGHFVQVGTGQRSSGKGPMADGQRPIPADMMARLQQGYDHWFNWVPVCDDAAFQDKLHEIPAPVPTFIPTLRRVTQEHSSLPAFQALLGRSELRQQIGVRTLPSSEDEATITETDLQNLRREQTEPSAEGSVYLIHMEGTTFYKIGMSLDPQIRLRTLQTGNPHTLTIRRTQVVADMRGAESRLHRRFEAQRIGNVNAMEWFDFGSDVGMVEAAFSAL